MDTKEVIRSRHSVRIFDKNKSISDDTLREIISLAQHAPSWVNSQPWRVYIATGQKADEIHASHKKNEGAGKPGNSDWATTHREDWDKFPREHMQEHNEHHIIFLNNDPKLIDLWRPEMQTCLYDAPVICYLTLPKNSNRWSCFDLGSFAQTLMLAAKDKGIDSIPAYEFVRFPDSVHRIMNIPDDEWICVGIGLGYPKDHLINDFRSDRISLDNMLKIEK